MTSLIIDRDPTRIDSNDLSSFTFKKKTETLYPLDTEMPSIPGTLCGTFGR